MKLDLRLSQRKRGSTFLLSPWKTAQQGEELRAGRGVWFVQPEPCKAAESPPEQQGRFPHLPGQKINVGREGLSYGQSLSDLASSASAGGCRED